MSPSYKLQANGGVHVVKTIAVQIDVSVVCHFYIAVSKKPRKDLDIYSLVITVCGECVTEYMSTTIFDLGFAAHLLNRAYQCWILKTLAVSKDELAVYSTLNDVEYRCCPYI